jgi:Fur family transcriptional regulator, peroxide stress response regulator
MLERQIIKLREEGYRITPQRRAILEFLSGNTSHPSANDIFAGVWKNDPSISLATVYNTLEILAKKGMLLELPIAKNTLNYDPDTSPHDHAYCTGCGTIIDIFPEKTASPQAGVEIRGFQVQSSRKVFYGKCDKCLEEDR